MRRTFCHLVISVLVTTTFTLSASYARADDDELEKILQQGLKEIDEQKPAEKTEKKAEPKKEAKKEEKKPEPKKEEPKQAKQEAPKPVEPKKIEAAKKEEPKAEQPRRAPIGAVKADPAPAAETVEEPQPAPVAPAKPVTKTPATAVKEVPGPVTPSAQASKPLETTEEKKPDAAAGTAAAPADGKDPKAKRTVSMAVNADQAALSGGALAKAWSINLNLSTSVGSGTFMPGSSFYATNPYVGQSLMLEAAYLFTLSKSLRLRVSLRETFSWEFTRVDNNSGQYFDWSDLSLGASMRAVSIPVVGIDVFTSLRLTAPISKSSLFQTMVLAVQPGVGLSKNIDIPVKGDWHMNVNIRYDIGFRKNFHRFTNALIDASSKEGLPLAVRAGTDPFIEGSLAVGGGTNVSHTLVNALTLSFTPQDMITLSAFASITNGWKYAGQTQVVADEFTHPNARLGPGRLETIRTNIDLTITPVSFLWISAGIFTAQPVFAPDNKTIMNPVWNQGSAANNYSTLYLSVGGQI